MNEGSNVRYARIFMKQSNVDKDDIDNVLLKAKETVEKVNQNQGRKTGLIFGRVQSGKTNSIISTMALMMDNKYRAFILLVSNDNSLNSQTVKRLKDSKLKFEVIDKTQLHVDVESYLQNKRNVVIVCPKNVNYLTALNKKLREIKSDLNWIIFDDEADQASLNNNINSQEESPSRINGLIDSLIDCSQIKAYIQVTATPQAILLQNVGSKFFPDFITILEPGTGYIGANELFGSESSPYLKPIKDDHMFNGDVHRDKDLTIETANSIIDSLLSFIIAASIKTIKEEESTFTYMAHVGREKEGHHLFKKYVKQLLSIINNSLNNINISEYSKLKELVDERFGIIYNDFKQSVIDIPPYEDVYAEASELINDDFFVQVVNSDESKDILYDARINFLVGGDRLSRGITIKNLVTTYYSRCSSAPKMDTMGQHARMFGYRESVLDVMRIFISESLCDNFLKITRAENELRKMIIDNKSTHISIPVGKGILPTKGTVYDTSQIFGLRGGISYNPRYPKHKNVSSITNELNEKLIDYVGSGSNKPIKVEINFILGILEIMKSSYERFVELIEPLIKGMKETYPHGFVIVRVDRDIKMLEDGSISTILSEDDRKLAVEDHPTLYIYRISGSFEKGWEGENFWIPIFRFPNNYDYLLNISHIEQIIS
nr:Z1 domain-containing protein [Heliobacterium chlorum]